MDFIFMSLVIYIHNILQVIITKSFNMIIFTKLKKIYEEDKRLSLLRLTLITS